MTTAFTLLTVFTTGLSQRHTQRCQATATDGTIAESSIYDQPQLYDEAFSYRDFPTEVGCDTHTANWHAAAALSFKRTPGKHTFP